MNFTQANEGKGNLYYSNGGKYTKNCQTAVLIHEARLRGLDITSLPYNRKGIQYELGDDSALGWIDANTGEKPELNIIDGLKMEQKLLEQTREVGRYNIGINSIYGDGHIVVAERLKSGKFMVYDPQTGDFKTLSTLIGDTKYIELLRVDNLLMEKFVITQIFQPL